MLTLEKKSVSNIPPLDAGSYPGRLLSVIDLGRQAQRPWQGQERPPVNKALLTYELSDEFLLDESGEELPDKPRVMSEQIALHPITSDRATSTKRYFAMDPDNKYEGNLAALLETPVMITIVQNTQQSTGRIFNNVAGLTPMRAKDSAKLGGIVNPPFFFDLEKPDLEVWATMHDWIKDIIKGGLEFQGSLLSTLLSDGGEPSTDPDNPF